MNTASRSVNSIVLVGALLFVVVGMAAAQQPAAGVPRPESLAEARTWLEANRAHPAYAQVAERALTVSLSVQEALEFLDATAAAAPDLSIRARLWRRAGTLAARGNRFEAAVGYLEAALRADPSNQEARLDLADAVLELGDLERAATLAADVINAAETLKLQRAAATARVRAWMAMGQTERSLRHLRALNAADVAALLDAPALLLQFEAATTIGDSAGREAALQRLTRHFPGAPETLVARGLANPTPTPARLLSAVGFGDAAIADATPAAPASSPATPAAPASSPATPTGPTASTPPATAGATAAPAPAAATQRVPVALQIGSFRDPENAEFMAQDVRRIGFQAQVVRVDSVDRSSFFRVIVPIADADQVQTMIARLKEHGIEGLMLFE